MNMKWMLLVLIALVFHPSFLHAEDKAPAVVAAEANAASQNAIDVVELGDDLALEDDDLIADEDLELDEEAELPAPAGEEY